MEIYNITHAVDIDGMSSAAFLVRYFSLPLKNIIFSNYSDKRFSRMESEIAKRKMHGALLIFSDFNVNARLLPRIVRLFSRLKKGGNSIIWLDHHPWGENAVKKISPFCEFIVEGENRERCGAELVYRMLCTPDKSGDRLAEFAHIADFALPCKSRKQGAEISRFAAAITYFNLGDMEKNDKNLRRIIKCLANGDYESAFVRKIQLRYRKIMDERVSVLIKSTKLVKVNGVQIAIGFSSRISGSIGCRAMMDRFRPKIALYVDYDPGEFSGNIRSKDGIDCSKIARALGGGGHPPASGFSIQKGSYDFSRPADRERFIKSITDLAKKLY